MIIFSDSLLVDVFAWWHSIAFAETFAEVSSIAEARTIGHFCDAVISGLQQFGSVGESELFDKVNRSKTCLWLYFFIESRTRKSHLLCPVVDIEVDVGNVFADDSVQAVDKFIGIIGLCGEFSQSLTNLYLVTHTIHLQNGANDNPCDEQNNCYINKVCPPCLPPWR